jgi:arylformamidase
LILYDISSTIEPDMPVYKNRAEKRPRFMISRDYPSDSVREGRLDFDLHSGTHIDLPLHVIPEGERSDSWKSDHFMTCCRVLDFSNLGCDRISAVDLEQKEKVTLDSGRGALIEAGWSILLKTSNSTRSSFDFSFVFLETSGAEFLADKGVAGVGIDALGIERDQQGHPTHRALLKQGIWILEGLRLAEAPEGKYILALLPLKIAGVEALPARALLLDPEGAADIAKILGLVKKH